MDSKGLVRIKRGASCLGILRDEFEVGKRGEGGHNEGEKERQPDDATNRPGHGPGDRIDAGPQNVSHNKEEEQFGSQHAFELWFLTFGRCFQGVV
ncbi:hypothetical protein D3C86_2060470 [compost metagenome]